MSDLSAPMTVFPFCAKCGTGNAQTTRFCTSCGASMSANTQTAMVGGECPCPACGKASIKTPFCRYCGERHSVTVISQIPSLLVGASGVPDPAPTPAAVAHAAPPPQVAGGATAAMGSVAVTMADGQRGPTYPIGLLEKTTVGRETGQMTFPDDPHMSPSHVELDGRGGALLVTDLGSLNGVFVRVTDPVVVPTGGTMIIGHQYLRARPVELKPPVVNADGTRLVGSDAPAVLWALERMMTTGVVRDTYALPGPFRTVGRDGADINFPHDDFVSAKHARLAPREDGVLLTDLESSNGCWYRMLEPTLLRHGAQILVGRTRLTLMLPH